MNVMTKSELRAELELWKADAEHWRQIAEKAIDPTIQDLRMKDGGIDIALTGDAVKRIAVIFVEYFKGLASKNYIEMTCIDSSNYDRYTVTMQKVGALSPADKVNILQKAIRSVLPTESVSTNITLTKALEDAQITIEEK